MPCLISRRAEFSAVHRYWLPELSEAENYQLFGAYSRFPGPGHNYILLVFLEGEIDQYGMVKNFADVKQVIHREVIEQLNYSYLNEVWPEFAKNLPTPENISRIIWQHLASQLSLVKIQLFEHPFYWAEYQGNHMEARISITTDFSAAHRLALEHLSQEENYQIYGKCANPSGHGHNYYLEVTVIGNIDSRSGRIVDVRQLRQVVNDYVIKLLDHTFLNKDIPYFTQVIPTAENIASYICQILKQPIQELGVELDRIKLRETANNSCEIYCRSYGNSSQRTTLKENALISK